LASENTIEENILSISTQESGVRLLSALPTIARRKKKDISDFVFLQIIKREMTYKIQRNDTVVIIFLQIIKCEKTHEMRTYSIFEFVI
jgi:hypothetical protein